MRRHPWLVMAVVAMVGVLLLGVLPTRSYFDQLRLRRDLAEEVQTLTSENAALAEQAGRLRTDEEVEHLARQRYQLVRPGEEAYAILPTGQPLAPTPAAAAPRTQPAESESWWSRAWHRVTSVL